MDRTRRLFRIGVDLDNTITPSIYLYNRPIWQCGLILSETLGEHSPYAPNLLKALQKLDTGSVATLGYSITRFPESWVTLYRELSAQVGRTADPDVEAELYRTALRFTRGPFRPYPGAVEALAFLKARGHVLYLISAGDVEFQNYKIDELGIRDLFEVGNIHIINGRSSNCKLQTMIRVFGPDPVCSIMVGDSKGSDIEPAQKLGVTTVWIPSETWSFSDSDQPVRPDYVIRSLAELPPVVRDLE